MSGFDHQPERAWDEYDWERFLQQQDHKTEKYMELLEKYLDDPQRDQIIAREMGWTQLSHDEEWLEEPEFESLDATAPTDDELVQSDEGTARPGETFEDHKLYRAAFSLTIWIDRLFDDHPSLQNEPSAVKVAPLRAVYAGPPALIRTGCPRTVVG